MKRKPEESNLVLEDSLQQKKSRVMEDNSSETKMTSANTEPGASVEKVESSNKEGPGSNLFELTCEILGVRFDNIDRKWVHDDVYMYTFNIVTEMMSFCTNLVVRMQTPEQKEVLDIMCTFTQPTKSYMLEIMPWVDSVTKARNFPWFINLVSSYNQQSLIRKEILKKFENSPCLSTEECLEEGGGILVHLCLPSNKEDCLIHFHWSLVYVAKKCKIEHYFKITPTDIGIEFAHDYKNILKAFCKLGISMDQLSRLWSELCRAVRDYDMGYEKPLSESE